MRFSSLTPIALLLGSILATSAPGHEVVNRGPAAASAVHRQLPASGHAITTAGAWLTTPPERRVEVDSDSRLSGPGSRARADRPTRHASVAIGTAGSTRSVAGSTTSIGARLLGLPTLPANAPPAP